MMTVMTLERRPRKRMRREDEEVHGDASQEPPHAPLDEPSGPLEREAHDQDGPRDGQGVDEGVPQDVRLQDTGDEGGREAHDEEE